MCRKPFAVLASFGTRYLSDQITEQCCHISVLQHEASVVVGCPKETSKFNDTFRNLPFTYGCYFFGLTCMPSAEMTCPR